MKKIAFVISIILSLTTTSYAQENKDKRVYENGKMYLLVLDKNNKQVSKVPAGKDVSIEYDVFYKSYDMFIVMEEGFSTMHLKYLADDKKSGSVKMVYDSKESGRSYYYVVDNLDSKGRLHMLSDKVYENGNVAIFVIEDAVSK